MIVKINNYKFQTDTNNVEFLVEIINNYYNEDNITMHSYNNIFPSSLGLTQNHITWQIEDLTHNALSNVSLPTSINLADFPHIMNHSTGFVIDGSGPNGDIFIRTKITEIETCNSLPDDGSERITSIEKALQSNKLTVYPNPTSELITIEVDENSIGLPYTITDLSGKVTISGIIKEEKTFVNINSLTNGEYYSQVGSFKPVYFRVVKN
jgi:hypothetical protein